MPKNEGFSDRLVRAIAAILIAALSYLYLTGWMMVVGYVVAVILIITAATGFCALYKVLGVNTNTEKEAKDMEEDM